jgi:hypothetical protein
VRKDKNKAVSGIAAIDVLLVLAIVALLGVGVFYVLSTPAWWTWCLDWLDMRGWDRTVWTGVAVALLVALATIRYWPEKRREKGTTDGHR